MKILLINSVFYPAIGWGGPITYTYNLARELTKKAHQVTVFTGDALDYNSNMSLDKREIIKDGFKIYYFRNRSKGIRYFFTPGMIMPILKHAKGFDIIHVHSYRQFQDVISFIILSLLGKRYVLTSHGYVLPHGKAKFYKKMVDYFIGKKILSHASRIIAFDEKQSQDYQEMGVKKENIIIIPNSINIENLPQKGGLKKTLNLSTDTKIVLYIGRIEKDKGITVLINAFSKIKNNNVHLVIAGPDFGLLSESKDLIKNLLIVDRIHFLGLLNNEEKWRAFVDANIVVYPSFHEAGIPMVILEAAAAARPMIISDSIGFAKEAVEHNAGLVCTPEDADNLAEKIQLFLDNLDEAEKMGLRAQQIIKKKFCLDTAIQQHLEVYNDVIKDN